MIYCKNCGTELEDGVHFCTECGAPVDNNKFEDSEPTTYYEESKPKSYYDKMPPFYTLGDKIRYIDNRSRSFKIFCIVMCIITLPIFVYGLFVGDKMIRLGCVFEFIMVGFFYLMNNLPNKNSRSTTPRIAIIFIIMAYILAISSVHFYITFDQNNDFYDDTDEYISENLDQGNINLEPNLESSNED